jgi:putative hydrolase of the HAD superfamily
MPEPYKHVFFDLDRTLYDFDSNNRKTLEELFQKYSLQGQGIENFDIFLSTYKTINYGLWQQYKKQQITKEFLNHNRFAQTLESFGLHNGQAALFAADYIALSPLQTQVLPGTFEILDYLHPRYPLHIITNGFEEIQFLKMERCGLSGYFTQVITSEKAGAQKPNPLIFELAFDLTGASPANSIIIGDDPESDIAGGLAMNMDQVWLAQPGETSSIRPTYQIGSLLELKNIL